VFLLAFIRHDDEGLFLSRSFLDGPPPHSQQ
jgi:hypothetical protein